jgi:hypothetical protein
VVAVLAITAALAVTIRPLDARAATLVCRSSVGPGIPPPASVPSGIPGFHAAWYGQSGYPTLCPGERSVATVAYYNSGSRGWVARRIGEMALLGTSEPNPGRDQPSNLGSRTGVFAPHTGWASDNRPAAQPADYVGPNQVAWFQFVIQAPTSPGTYFLYLRPVIDGATWMEDYGVYWQVTVQAAEPAQFLSVTPTTPAILAQSESRTYTAIVNGSSDCVDLAFVDAEIHFLSPHGELPNRDDDERADFTSAGSFTTVNGASVGASYVDCIPLPADRTISFTVTAPLGASVQPLVYRDLNRNNALDLPRFLDREQQSENWAWGMGGTASFAPPNALPGNYTVTVGAVAKAAGWFADAANVRSFRYDPNDSWQIGSATVPFYVFQQHLSRGDTISIGYAADPSGVSTFNITSDAGVLPPRIDATVDGFNGGPAMDDVQITYFTPPSNVDPTWYSMERAVVAAGTTTCGSSSGSYDLLQYLLIGGGQATSAIDPDRPSGTYCYRSAVLGEPSFGYSNPATIADPPRSTRPLSLDARYEASVAGVRDTLDDQDVLKIAFNEPVTCGADPFFLLRDADGTLAYLQRDQNVACTMNTAPESVGGVSYPALSVVTMRLIGSPGVTESGTRPGLQVGASMTQSPVADLRGNAWDLATSPDIVFGDPD